MRSHAFSIGEVIVNFFFPKWCVGCGKQGDYFCDKCSRHLARIHAPLCPQCGRPQTNSTLCPSCVCYAAAIDGIRAPFRFEGPIRQAVHDLKYRNIRVLAKPLASLMYDYMSSQNLAGDVLVPVPLHSKRLKERGYNQSGLLARELGRLTRLPVTDGCLVKHRHTAQQAKTSSLKERLENVADVFACKGTRLKGLTVLLIDDVATSGATMNAAAVALKAAGASSVWGLAIAKEI